VVFNIFKSESARLLKKGNRINAVTNRVKMGMNFSISQGCSRYGRPPKGGSSPGFKKEGKMVEPTCPKCEGHYFKKKYFDGVYIVYCDKCGHIVGCIVLN